MIKVLSFSFDPVAQPFWSIPCLLKGERNVTTRWRNTVYWISKKKNRFHIWQRRTIKVETMQSRLEFSIEWQSQVQYKYSCKTNDSLAVWNIFCENFPESALGAATREKPSKWPVRSQPLLDPQYHYDAHCLVSTNITSDPPSLLTSIWQQ